MAGFTHTEASVGVASGLALAANGDRKWALFQNDSDSVIYLRIGEAAVANEGIRLDPVVATAPHGQYEISRARGILNETATSEIYTGASKHLLVTEYSN
jgi:hypothetical protein